MMRCVDSFFMKENVMFYFKKQKKKLTQRIYSSPMDCSVEGAALQWNINRSGGDEISFISI